jgi:hypothetical protein
MEAVDSNEEVFGRQTIEQQISEANRRVRCRFQLIPLGDTL